jgi:excisionase family DNA binding protein
MNSATLTHTATVEPLTFSNISNKLPDMTTFSPSQKEILTSATIAEFFSNPRVPESPKLITGDSEPIELPAELARAFALIAQDFAAGKAVTVIAHEAKMTTQQAADFLAVSRPTLIKLLSEFDVDHETIGRHRKIAFSEVSRLKTKIAAKRSMALSAMRNESQQIGMLEDTAAHNPLIR